MWTMHKSFTGGAVDFFRLFTDPDNRVRNLLLLMMVLGIFVIFHQSEGRYFHPRGLIMIIFPALVILLSWLYVKAAASSIKVISRDMPGVCLENELVEIELLVHYSQDLPFPQVTLVDDFPAVDVLSGPEIMLSADDFIGGSALINYKLLLNRGYGDFVIGPTTLTIRDPFNLFEEKRVFAVKTPLKVWLNPPAPEDLDLVKANALTPMGDSRSSLAGYGMDFYGIKEYVQGDDIRAMSWLKTAQLGQPVIKQFERDTRPDVLVLVHTDRQQIRGFGFGNTMKRLLRIAAAIIGETCERGLPASLGLCLDGSAHHLKLNRSSAVYGFMTELLAGLQPAEPGGLQQLLSLAMNRAGPGTILILLSQTLSLPLDDLLNGLLALRARGAKVALWAIDDADQVRFSEEIGLGVSKQEFVERLSEMDLDLVLLPSRNNSIAAGDRS